MAKKQKHRPQTLIDVLIPVHGQFELLEKCLNALPEAIGEEISYQVIIFDNGSPKEEADEFYRELSNSIRITRNRDNIGFPAACNRLVAMGKSPLIFLLNSDVILDPMSVDKLVRVMDEPKVGVVGMKLIFPEDVSGLDIGLRPSGKIQHIGLSTNIRGEVFHPFIGWSPDHPRVNMQREVFAVTGAALMTRRSIWNKVGGFFEGYGRGTYEEVDFQMIVRELGYNILVEPQASGVHYAGATVEKYKLGYDLRHNSMLFMQRWGQKLLWWHWRQA